MGVNVSGSGAAYGAGAGALLGDPLLGAIGGGLIGGLFGGDPPTTANVSRVGSGPYAPIGAVDLSYKGTPISMVNPGMVNPMEANPYAGAILGQNRNLYNMYFNSAAGGAFNPDFYHHMQDTQQNQLTTSLDNQYARMGLGGSGAEMGGLGQAIQNNQMSWMNRQQSDQQKALQGLSNLNNQAYGETMGIQGQYGAFQNEYNQNMFNVLGMQQHEQDMNNQMMASMFSSLMSGASKAASAAAMA